MASKRREDKGRWEKLKGKKNKQLNQVTFAHLSHYTQHVAYSSKVKSQDNPSPSVHCYLSLRIHSKRDSNDFTAGYIWELLG